MRKLLLVGFILLLAGCATTGSSNSGSGDSSGNYYTKTIESWQDGSLSTLLSRWGHPSQMVRMADRNVYIYKTESYTTNPTSGSPAIGVNVVRGGKPVIMTPTQQTDMVAQSQRMSIHCIVTFTAVGGKIVGTDVQGNGCYGGSEFYNRLGNHG